MSCYRKVDPRFWQDEFQTLDATDKLMVLYLFTAKSNRIGCFVSVISGGFTTWEPILFIPTWWKYNHPENPNNVIGNLGDLSDLPAFALVARFCWHTTHLSDLPRLREHRPIHRYVHLVPEFRCRSGSNSPSTLGGDRVGPGAGAHLTLPVVRIGCAPRFEEAAMGRLLCARREGH
jgi:hypothetical protein